MTLNAMERRALEYVRNTNGGATAAIFDEDHEPIGPQLRAVLMPTFVRANDAGALVLTDAGREAVKPVERREQMQRPTP